MIKKQTHRCRKQTYGIVCLYDIYIQTLYSAGNYIQDLVITYNGKESEKEYV